LRRSLLGIYVGRVPD